MIRQPAAYLRNSKDPGTRNEHLARLLASVPGGKATLYDDWNRSGDRRKLSSRTGWLALCKAVEAGKHDLVVMNDIDRGGRSMEEWLRFMREARDRGVRVVAGGIDWASPEHRMEFNLRILIAEEELEADKRRAAATQVMLKARGDVLGVAPYGWKNVRESYDESGRGHGKVTRVPNPLEPVDALVAAVRLTRGNLLGACKLLNAQGIRSRGGAPWASRTLERTVRLADPSVLRKRAPTRMINATGALRPPATLYGLVQCHCGATMIHREVLQSMICPAGLKLGKAAHGRYVSRDRHVYALLDAETRRVGQVLVRRTPAEPPKETRADLEEDRMLAGTALANRAMTLADFNIRIASLDAALADLDDLEADAGLWDKEWIVDWGAGQVELGDALRRAFKVVRLDDQMLPIEAVWREGVERPERMPGEIGLGSTDEVISVPTQTGRRGIPVGWPK